MEGNWRNLTVWRRGCLGRRANRERTTELASLLPFSPSFPSRSTQAIHADSLLAVLFRSIILIATTHVRKGLFDIFRQIVRPALSSHLVHSSSSLSLTSQPSSFSSPSFQLIPSYILIASSAMCIVIYPIHHVIPFPGPATTSFRSATPRYKFYKITRMALPLLVLLVQLVGVVYFLAVALTKAGPDTDTKDSSIPLGEFKLRAKNTAFELRTR